MLPPCSRLVHRALGGFGVLAMVAASACSEEAGAGVASTSTSIARESTTAPPSSAPHPSTTPPPPTTARPHPTTTTARPHPTTTTTSTTAAPTAAPDSQAAAVFDYLLATNEMGHGAPAVSIAVSRNGVLVNQAAFGYANPDTGQLASADQRFRIASVSKLLTAIVVMQLVQEGRLSLGDTPLPALATRQGVGIGDMRMGNVTVGMMLSHTSGLAPKDPLFFGGKATSCADAARQGLPTPLLSDPGTTYNYSNFGFCLLGLVIEEVTGQSYEAAVTQRLLTPLGITDMRLAGTFDVRPGDVTYRSTPTRLYMEALGGAGGWIATAPDLARIADSLDVTGPGWHPLSAASVAEMRTPHAIPPVHHGALYGYGLILWDDGSWGHTGSVESARSIVVRYPDGVTVVVLASAMVPEDPAVLRTWIAEARAAAANYPTG